MVLALPVNYVIDHWSGHHLYSMLLTHGPDITYSVLLTHGPDITCRACY